MNETGEIVHRAAEIIREGGIVAFPTETVYGLGADAFNPIAVARIFEVKRRPRFDPLIVHIAETADLARLFEEVPSTARKLIDRFWPGPLTIVLPKREGVPDIVTAGLPTVAVRMPDHPVAHRLIELAGRPVAAPSANPFGYLSPTTAEDVREQLGDDVDIILDGGPCRIGVESTILFFSEKRVLLLRPGGIPLEEIESTIGKIEIGTQEGILSPGLMRRHYAPRTPVVVENGIGMHRFDKKRVGLLAFKPPVKAEGFARVEILSERGDMREAASNLFSALRRLEKAGLDLIVAETVPESGLGMAIMDRLRRASAGSNIIFE